MRILVVGGVAAGASAATRARRCNEDAEIIIFEKGNYVSFANCGLPYYIGGVIEDRDDLLLVTPELFRERFAIDVRLQHEVLSINREKKTITVNSPAGTAEEPYDKLILAAGGRPIQPPIPGTQLDGVHTVFTVPDADRIVSALEAGTQNVVIIGGGFIGLETAEAMLRKGVKTTLVERLPYVMNTMDPEFSEAAARHLREIGVDVRLGSGLAEARGQAHVESVVLENGDVLPCDMLVLAMGVTPSTALAKEAGLEIGVTGGVKVDATMRSSDPSIYCAGDMVESLHLVTGKPVRIPLAGSATSRAASRVRMQRAVPCCFRAYLAPSIVKIGELTLAKTGLSEAEAEKQGLQYQCAFVPGFSNATYYPGAAPMVLKLTIETPTGKLLGAQGIGRKGVDKRIDVLATALYAGLTVFDLENLDLAYAPPYASAKDPRYPGRYDCWQHPARQRGFHASVRTGALPRCTRGCGCAGCTQPGGIRRGPH